MKNLITNNMTVGDFAARHPHARRVFEKYAIDYCCEGGVELKKALQAKGLSEETLLEELESVRRDAPEAADERVWTDAPLSELVEHIVSKHHMFMKTALQRTGEIFDKVLAAHGKKHGKMLKALKDTFYQLRGEIEMHLFKEEQILFPYIVQAEESEKTGSEPPEFHCGALANPINQMIHEHDSAGEALAKMRTLTSDYTLPEDACQTFRELYSMLQAIEKDLHEHIHLENSILFPRSLKFDARCAAGRSE